MTTDAATQVAPVATQAPAQTESEADLAEGMALLDEIEGKETQPPASTEPTASADTEPNADKEALDPDLDALLKAERETASEKAAREAVAKERAETETRTKQQHVEQQIRGAQQAFAQRATAIRSHLAQVAEGTVDLDVNGILNEFNAHHAQIAPITSMAYWDALFARAPGALTEADAKDFVSKRASFNDFEAALDDYEKRVAKKANEGRLTDAEVRRREALAVVKAKRKWDADLAANPGLAAERVRPVEGRSRGTSAAPRNASWLGSLTPEEYAAVPSEERNRIWAAAERR